MTAQGWLVLGMVALAAAFFFRQVFQGLTRKAPPSCCGDCAGSCGAKIEKIKVSEKIP